MRWASTWSAPFWESSSIDEDRRLLPDRRLRDQVDDLAERVVVLGDHRRRLALARAGAGGVVVGKVGR